MNKKESKQLFIKKLKDFAGGLTDKISKENEWTIRGFIDIFKKVHTISSDTKVVSKILELHLFPYFSEFAKNINYDMELARYQNWYPDLTFINKEDKNIKFAVDIKTTYRNENSPELCNGFTLGSHGEYFCDRKSHKNIQYPYNEYSGHFCVGIIYSRADLKKDDEIKIYDVVDILKVPAVIKNFIFFAEEKWKIASDKGGSGNTANIGSIRKIDDILNGNGTFAKAGEALFDDYWMNYGKIQNQNKDGKAKKITKFKDYCVYRRLPTSLINDISEEVENNAE
ncbi:type II restriction endonuclease [Synergistes jonesii]|uniref:type II restriction endonuclease n=1 Tax=Synergistes jonesii TaxID=2754 RepID=UPI00248DE8FF|nr:type II restriction endonuclease [Synergistes jonesii]